MKEEFLLYWKKRRRELLNALTHYIWSKGLSFSFDAGYLFVHDKHKIVDTISDNTIELYLILLGNIDKRIGQLGGVTLDRNYFFSNYTLKYFNYLKETFEFN